MRTSTLLVGALLLSALAAPRTGAAQSTLQNGVWVPGRGRLPLGYYGENAMQRVLQPAAAWLPDPTAQLEAVGPLQPEPDTATQGLFARNRVRAVLRLRLDDEGGIRDTVGYQEIDQQGRWLVATTGSATSPTRRQWSYDAQGQCVSRIDAPTQRWPFLTTYHFNPATRQGVQKAVLSDGSAPTLTETQLYRHGDTTLTQSQHHRLTVNGRPYGSDLLQRVFTYSPHPDTTLTLTGYYTAKGRRLRVRASYQLYRRGQPVEFGELAPAVLKAAKTSPQPEGVQELQLLLGALRQGQPRQVQQRYAYDRWNRIVRRETITALPEGLVSSVIVRFTYNTRHQLIGREETTTTGRQGAHYTVFSYEPTGLLASETTDRQGSKTMFRYQYAYYE